MSETLAAKQAPVAVRCRAMASDERRAWHWAGIPGEPEAQFGWLLLRWRLDWVACAIELFRTKPAPYQVAILLDLSDAPLELYEFYGVDPAKPKRQVLIPSGHGLGKTRVLALAIWIFLITHKFSKTVATAPSSDQLTEGLWGELRKLYRRMKARWPAIADEWQILGTSITHKNPDFGDWQVIARTARPEKPEALQGAHAADLDDEFDDLAQLFGEQIDQTPSGGIMIVAEEASGVDDKIRQTLQGSLSEEGARFIAPGNPTRPDGWFATDCDKIDRYAVHVLDCRQSDRSRTYTIPYRDFGGRVHALKIRGMVRPEYVREILEECDGDENHDIFRVRVAGLKPRSAFTQCIKTHWVEAAFARAPDPASLAEPAIIALDFGLTGDQHALAVRRGFAILDGEEWLPKDKPEEITLDAADRAIEAQRLYKARYIIGDSNGVGRGAMEYLARYYRERMDKNNPLYVPGLNVTVIHFNSGAGALDDRRFYRRRDEMWFKKGREFFADPRVSMPEFPRVKTQLTTPGYHENAARKITVESKEQIFKRTKQPSGNLADAILESLMVQILPETHKDTPKEDPIPAVFRKHFDRWNARRFGGHPSLIQ
jgi:phage terminase large subunit